VKAWLATPLPSKRGSRLERGLKPFLSLLAAGALAVSCGNPNAQGALEAGWVRECPSDAFCFSRPATLKARPVQAIDSLVALYQGDDLSLSFDMGRFGTTVDSSGKATLQAVTIHGRPGHVASTDRAIVLTVPKVHESVLGTVKFSMILRAKVKVPADIANKIFESIEFKPPR
jgi:hypothetical protein